VRTLAVEDVAADAFAHRHRQIDIQSNSCDTNAGVLAVAGSEIRVVMIVAIVMMSSMSALVQSRRQGHDGLRR
jgi:hypothetical protein